MASKAVREPEQRVILADWRSSGLSSAEYCRRHGITFTQFRNWVNRLKRRDAAATKVSMANRKGKSRPVSRVKTVQGRQRIAKEKALRAASKAGFAAEQRAAGFAEVRLVEPERRKPSVSKQDNMGVLEIVLTTGITVRLGSSCPVDLLSSVMSVLENS